MALLASAAPAQAQGTLRVAITASDVPTTTGVPTQGLEAWSYAGYPIFEPLVMWDLRVTDAPPPVIPWLATEWSVDPEDHTRWAFKLRDGVTFHDGSNFDADAVVWNLDRFYKEDAPQFEASTSLASSRPVAGELFAAMLNTLQITLFSAVIGFGLGIFFGAVSALNAGKWPDRLFTLVSIAGVSVPHYWLAILLVTIFSVQFNVLPAQGMCPAGFPTT